MKTVIKLKPNDVVKIEGDILTIKQEKENTTSMDDAFEKFLTEAIFGGTDENRKR